jgi:hypothetical protein
VPSVKEIVVPLSVILISNTIVAKWCNDCRYIFFISCETQKDVTPLVFFSVVRDIITLAIEGDICALASSCFSSSVPNLLKEKYKLQMISLQYQLTDDDILECLMYITFFFWQMKGNRGER